MASEPITLHGYLLSPAVMRVLAALYEKKLDFKYVEIDLHEAEEQKKEPFLSLNPFGQVPALEHGDLKLFDWAIKLTKMCRIKGDYSYISHAFATSGTQLITPDDHKKMAITTMWIEVESHQFNTPTNHLGWELGYKPLIGDAPDEAVVKENEAKLGKILDVYEARLSKSKYLGGDEYNLADLHHIPHIWYLMRTPAMELFVSRPHVNAWCQDIMGRPAWLQVDVQCQKAIEKLNEELKKKAKNV